MGLSPISVSMGWSPGITRPDGDGRGAPVDRIPAPPSRSAPSSMGFPSSSSSGSGWPAGRGSPSGSSSRSSFPTCPRRSARRARCGAPASAGAGSCFSGARRRGDLRPCQRRGVRDRRRGVGRVPCRLRRRRPSGHADRLDDSRGDPRVRASRRARHDPRLRGGDGTLERFLGDAGRPADLRSPSREGAPAGLAATRAWIALMRRAKPASEQAKPLASTGAARTLF